LRGGPPRSAGVPRPPAAAPTPIGGGPPRQVSGPHTPGVQPLVVVAGQARRILPSGGCPAPIGGPTPVRALPRRTSATPISGCPTRRRQATRSVSDAGRALDRAGRFLG
jgi:hypothetical protein